MFYPSPPGGVQEECVSVPALGVNAARRATDPFADSETQGRCREGDANGSAAVRERLIGLAGE